MKDFISISQLRQKLLPQTLFGRSLMIIALPILLLQMIVAFIFFDRHWDSTANKLVFALCGEVQMITEQIEHGTPEQQRQVIDNALKTLDLEVSVKPADKSGLKKYRGKLGRFYWFTLHHKLNAELTKRLDRDFVVQPDDKDHWFQIIVQLDKSHLLKFVAPERRLTGSTTYIFLLWVIGSAAILFSIAILFMRNQIRPIMRLAVAAEKIGKGQDVPDFRPVGAAEVRQASRAFLQMKDRLKRQIEQRTAMLSGVSHDLRTPLTRMKLQIALAQKTPDIETLSEDIAEMEKMLEGYLAFARGEGSEQPENTDMRSLISTLVAKTKRQGNNIQESYQDDKMVIKIRPMAIERALSNILNNACKFAQNIWIHAGFEGGLMTITIDDDGPGIPAHLREDVFKPFYRIEKSRNKDTGGIGLGLSIALDIVHAHGGEIVLHDSRHGGLRAVVTLPV